MTDAELCKLLSYDQMLERETELLEAEEAALLESLMANDEC